MDFDTAPIDFAAYQYTLEDACQISGVAPDTLRSWIKRKTVSVGRKHPKLHRWFFSGVDIIRLRTMNDLIETCGARPSVVEAVADSVVARFWESHERNPTTGKMLEIEAGFRKDKRLMVSFAGGEPMVAESAWDGTTYSTPSPSIGHWAERFRRPHILIPADKIISDVQFAIIELHKRDAA